jgi:multidrug resistance efflux pump
VSLRKHLESLIDERDRRYAQRFDEQEKALAAALLATKELTQQASSFAKDAAQKFAAELQEYKAVNNEWRATVNDWRQNTVPRAEYNVRHEELERRMASAEVFKEQATGRYAAKTEDRGQGQWIVSLIVGTAMGIIVLIASHWWK